MLKHVSLTSSSRAFAQTSASSSASAYPGAANKTVFVRSWISRRSSLSSKKNITFRKTAHENRNWIISKASSSSNEEEAQREQEGQRNERFRFKDDLEFGNFARSSSSKKKKNNAAPFEFGSSASGSALALTSWVFLNELFVEKFSLAFAEDASAVTGIFEGQTSKSYYATLFLFVLSAPGLYSLVKRSAKSKISRKTFELPGPKADGQAALPLDDVAREISMYFKRNNYVVADAGEVITFEGNIAPERGTAAYITFCIAVGLLCVGLVCSIALPGGNLWYSLAIISPLSGKYYLDNAGRREKVKVKMVDNERTTDVIVEGDADEIERFRRDLNLCEKGMVRVKGLLEQ